MKKTAIALMTLAAVLVAAACQKVDELAPKSVAMTISAVSEGVGAPQAKADLAYMYEVLWAEGDKILVRNQASSAQFTLYSGQGTAKGTFSSSETISGEVEAFYPASIVAENGDLVWPYTFENKNMVPLYCKKTITGTTDVPMTFSSLGSVLQLVLSTPLSGITLKSIEVSADEAMSGAFQIDENGQAVIDASGSKSITLDLGEGVAVGNTAKFFYIPIPSGTYTNLTISFNATDGTQCTKKASSQTINPNSVARLALSATAFKVAGILPGLFSVSNDGGSTVSKVHFSQGNLTYNVATTKWAFYEHQYDCAGCYDANLISLFTWGYGTWSTVPSTQNYLTTHTTKYDTFTQSEDWGSRLCNGNIWRTLSIKEWDYLINTRTMTNGKDRYTLGITYGGKSGLVLYPDDYDGEPVSGTVSTLPEGVVFLPAAGFRNGSSYIDYQANGYWSSSASNSSQACVVTFDDSAILVDDAFSVSVRSRGFSVRLVIEGEPVEHRPVVPVESVSLDKTEMEVAPGKTDKLTATVNPDNATIKDVIWTSSNPAIATVDADGTVTGVAEGTATITAIADGLKTAACEVTVKSNLPVGALSGIFSVSNDSGKTVKQVYFSQGNLWCDASGATPVYNFEDNQYSGTTYAANHVSHFYWSKTASVAYA